MFRKALTPIVLIAALGYFVDIYDLILFSIVRVESLKTLGVTGADLLNVGVHLINMQMFGMLLGGILWGIVGDKRGRVSVLFGSILLYSLANIANAFVTSVEMYAVLRFIAGIGLAGELGAAITLVSETLPSDIRGIGTSIVAGVGVAGAILAAIVGQQFTWQTAYIVGGLLGLLLLVARLKVLDSSLFHQSREAGVARGSFFQLFTSSDRFFRYVRSILIGIPLWFVVGILATFSPEICKELGATGPVSAGTSVMCNYFGLIIGDFGSGLVSQWMASRRKAIGLFIAATGLFTVAFVFTKNVSPEIYYGLFILLGISAGYWAMFVTVAAEQFGTNLRATVATTVPNFVRGSVPLLTFGFQMFRHELGLAMSALTVGAFCFALALLGLWRLRETFGVDLNFQESISK